MTTTSDKPVTRETRSFVRDKGLRPVIATIHGGLLILRPKGLRTEETLEIGALWAQAIKARVFRERMDKGKAKKVTRRGRR